MKTQKKFSYVEILFFIIAIAFIFACGPLPITKTYTAISPDVTASSLAPRQVSLGGSYTSGENSYLYGKDLAYANHTTERFEYYNASARVGMVRGLDFGIDYSYRKKTQTDLDYLFSNDYNYGYDYNSERSFSKDYHSLWLNLKYQLTNKDLKPGKAIFTLGMMQGFAYGYTGKDKTMSITSLPICLGIPINSTDLIQFTNKLEYVDYSYDSYTRITLGLGADVAIGREEKDVMVFKLKPRVGYIVDNAENNDSSSWYFNIGLSIDLSIPQL